MTKYTTKIEETSSGELFVTLPETLMAELGWDTGDRIEWIDNKDGSWSIKKVDTEFVLVETVSTFRHQYVVEVPRGKAEWALDTVVMGEADEFSQGHVDENIFSYRTVTRQEVLDLCNKQNDYAASWSDAKKFEVFVTDLQK